LTRARRFLKRVQRTGRARRTSIAVSGFREHFLEKYFAYRRRYVDHILGRAPARARLANLAEIARLAFVALGSGLVALIFWLLTAGAAARTGVFGWLPLFALLALASSAAALGSLAGLTAALRDRPRVSAAAAVPGNGAGR